MGSKQCPVDRGKLLIGLECCAINRGRSCAGCPYDNCDAVRVPAVARDALAYIYYLEEQLSAKGI